MKNLIVVLVIGLLLQGCSSLNTLSTWVTENDESMVLVRIATAETLFKDASPGSAEVCGRASRGVEIISRARSVLDNTVLSLPSLDTELQRVIINAGLNPVTAAILLDIATGAVAEYKTQADIGAIPPGARITLNSLIDAVSGVVSIAGSGC